MDIKRLEARPRQKAPWTGSRALYGSTLCFRAPIPPAYREQASLLTPARVPHTHPLGQTLIITAACGWVQRAGGPVEEVRAGDVVWFEPGEKHWHGGTPTSGMTHIAIQERQNGRVGDWMEYVTDEQYIKGMKRDIQKSAASLIAACRKGEMSTSASSRMHSSPTGLLR